MAPPTSRSFLAALLLSSTAFVRADTVYSADAGYDSGAYGVTPTQSFYTSDLLPPALNFKTNSSSASSNYTFLSYRGTDAVQPAPIIVDNNGDLVWSGADQGISNTMDLLVQEYQGEPVLTTFVGDFYAAGYGMGHWLMMNSSYDIIKNVTVLNQTESTSDFHEFVITENNTALVESWVLVQADLTALNGSTDGWTFDCRFQEIDIATDTLLFSWSAMDHVSIDETYFEISDNAGNSSSNPMDWYALEKDANGNYLISMRGPSTLYSISSTTGEILWRLSGKNSNFTMGTDATFWYQHDARFMTPITSSPFNISLFDNAAGGGAPAEATARGLVLSVDTDDMTVTLMKEFIPSFNSTAASQGSVQPLDNGNFLVGWGAEAYYSEYDIDETLIQDVHFASDNSTVMSYRAFKMSWTGTPSTTPAFAINSTGTTTAYVSWNGATEVVSWALMGGSSATNLSTISTTAKSGFETSLDVSGSYTYLAAAALSSSGECLGATEIYEVSTLKTTGTAGSCPSGTTSTASTSATSETTSGATSLQASAAVLAFSLLALLA
ncbi:arylsulfotransferase [Pseudohyphozyma bogoriensis]|nr:arylsulfotransferase [Pseudohyphozyma bogoriensis]